MKHLVFFTCLSLLFSFGSVSAQSVDDVKDSDPVYVFHAVATVVMATVSAVIAIAMFIEIIAKPPRKRTSWLRKRNKQELVI